MQLLSCEKLRLTYDGVTVISDLSFDVKSGDYLCIVGENGSGKSTLVKALLGLKKLSEGSISFCGGLEKKEIGYLPQQTFAQKNFPASALEIVMSGRLNSIGIRPFFNKADKNAALENMKKLGILKLKNRCYRELSGGQQQRVLLARALCATKKLLVLDEPISGLDPLAAEEMYCVLKRLNREDGVTIIMVSHDIPSAVRHATHILHLRNKPLFFGAVEDYVKSPVCFALGGKHDN